MTKIDADSLEGIDLNQDSLWQDGDVLYTLYTERGYTQDEIGDFLGCSGPIVHKWMKRNGIESRSPSEANQLSAQKRREQTYERIGQDTLEELYWENGMSTHDIADEIGESHSTVHRAMEYYNIPRRSKSEAISLARRDSHPYLTMTVNGYVNIETTYQGETDVVKHHRLIAVAECGFEAVSNNVVHHKNNIPWDNRPENLEVMSSTEHKKLHGKG